MMHIIPVIDDEENHTTDYRLYDFDLKPGDKFCYVFDFGKSGDLE